MTKEKIDDKIIKDMIKVLPDMSISRLREWEKHILEVEVFKNEF